ncbi:MAG TPA: SpoIIE family protein phosphatase [Candidatus Acidoferrales bacterium]|nr:SpoIIE family protein phosphatase [Candidatus Acidoferrales bacterium]
MSAQDKRTILLVDDTPANIQVAQSILKDDYKLRIATNGVKALELTKAAPAPDLILLDVMMPEMDGYEVCALLKADPATRDIPVIFLTGKTEAEDETRGFEVGAVDYIHKPFSPSVVNARVRTQLMLREAREQLSRQLVAINNELEMARQIQLSILPSAVPAIKGLEIAARYVPMSAVAGDFYDFIAADDKHLGILIADVSGHGLSAALIASMIQVALAGQSAHASDPARVLGGLNQALCGKFKTNFVTAAYMYVDLEKHVISYAGAGHPPMLLRRDSAGSVEEVCENGLVLGQFPEAIYQTVQLPFGAGDRAVLYTDGVVEARNPSQEQFGTDRIKEFLQTKRNLAVGQFADALLEELWRWSELVIGQGQGDDITVLVIDFEGQRRIVDA